MMNIITLFQPQTQLGNAIAELLRGNATYTRIVFVSAFVALRTILRLRDGLLGHVEDRNNLKLVVGIDLGGTSREVLQELLRWNCKTFVFHNTIPRASFHPKLYLFESPTRATLFVGSNNLTDGGLYTNYEAATRYDFDLPADAHEYQRLLRPLNPFINPNGPTVCRLDALLIQTLVDRHELPSEAEARERRARGQGQRPPAGEGIPASPFAPVAVPLPPLLPENVRGEEPAQSRRRRRPVGAPRAGQPAASIPPGALVWRKKLPQSDALQVAAGSHHVGGVRLTQARFENPTGHRINQTTYFRQLFADYDWEREPGRQRDQEHTFVPMRVIIRGRDYGTRNFEISHKPSGEAGQDNYTTILRWGREFTPTIVRENLTGAVLSLHETADEDAPFLMDIRDA
jgi:HKD family nuclease